VTDGSKVWTESWGPEGWYRSGVSIAAVASGTPVSAADLAALGIDPDMGEADVLRQVGDDLAQWEKEHVAALREEDERICWQPAAPLKLRLRA